jgi:hypothetical protein
MKLNTVFIAAASLLGLAAAAVKPNEASISSVQDDKVKAEVTIDNSVPVSARKPDQCYLNCHLPWKQCVQECTSPNTSFCEHKCNCELFSDPKQLCRVRSKLLDTLPMSHCADSKSRLCRGAGQLPCL